MNKRHEGTKVTEKTKNEIKIKLRVLCVSAANVFDFMAKLS